MAKKQKLSKAQKKKKRELKKKNKGIKENAKFCQAGYDTCKKNCGFKDDHVRRDEFKDCMTKSKCKKNWVDNCLI